MTRAGAAQPRTHDARVDGAVDAAIESAIDALVESLGLAKAQRAGAREAVTRLVDDLRGGRQKLPHVSAYAARTSTGTSYRVTYRVPGYPRRTERLGRMPKPAWKRAVRISEILQQVKARLMKPEAAYRELYVDATPISRHVEQFRSHLRTKGVVDQYLSSRMTRLTRCIELAGYSRLSDVRRSTLPNLTERLRAYVDPATKRKLSASTINDYLGTLRQFVRWAVTTDKIPVDPLQYSAGVKNDSRKKRREILVEELAQIVSVARTRKLKRIRMRGDDRAMLYLTAYATGFRRTELRLLQVDWLRLDADPPEIVLPAGLTGKHRREARQPLPLWFAAELKAWLGKRRSGRVFQYMPQDVAEMFDRDREAARQAWIDAAAGDERDQREQSGFLRRQTIDGEVVFHSHRHAFSSNLVANLDIKSAQMLTRHATTSILLDTYAHARRGSAAEGVERSIPQPLTAAGGALAQGAAQKDRQ